MAVFLLGGRHGDKATGGWYYRTAYFFDSDNKYYRCRISVSLSKNGNGVYNIGEMEEELSTAATDINAESAIQESSSDNSISSRNKKVNGYSADDALLVESDPDYADTLSKVREDARRYSAAKLEERIINFECHINGYEETASCIYTKKEVRHILR
ncbi:MAG: hypothetical protein ACI3VK_05780 [Oscillospiraceae bacterium]